MSTIHLTYSLWHHFLYHRRTGNGNYENLFIYLFISSLLKTDLHFIYKKPINVNTNTTYTSFNKLPNNNDNNESIIIMKLNDNKTIIIMKLIFRQSLLI